MSFEAGEVISYMEMCLEEGTSLQRGMNYRLKSGRTVVLMSRRSNAPYSDVVLDEGRVLVYEGHDIPKSSITPIPKLVDQPEYSPSGSLTQNGHFYKAANETSAGNREAERIRVYEKLFKGTWVFNGIFNLVDAYQESDGTRKVFKFRLELASVNAPNQNPRHDDTHLISNSRLIPTDVKREVWKRDKGICVICGNDTNLHFDHIVPFSRGGTSLLSSNIQLLCATHNLQKSNRIE